MGGDKIKKKKFGGVYVYINDKMKYAYATEACAGISFKTD